MGFRITTNMMMSTYRYNLMNSTNTLSGSMDKVQTQRNFNSYAEDPASASQAFRLRRQWCQTNSQLDNTDTTYNKFHTAWTNLAGIINDLSDANARVSAIRGTTGTAGESRSALALVLRETADSVVESMNQKVGEQFIFSGNDGLNVPFTWNEDHTVLYYRGVNVNSTDPADIEKLEIMSKEELNLDMGIGLKEDANGKLINGSAFDSALRGISFIGSGVDKDGDPQNLALVMRELADVFQAWDEDTDPQGYNPELAGPSAQGLSSDELKAKANRLLDKLNAAQERTTEKYVELNARSAFLKTNSSRLSDEITNLNEQVLNVEQINLAAAIEQLSWDQTCYNAALKIGNQLLSQSLIDYMN